MRNKKVTRIGVAVLLVGAFVAVGTHEWLALAALLVGCYAGGAINYKE